MRRLRPLATLVVLVVSMLTMFAVAAMATEAHTEPAEVATEDATGAEHGVEPEAEHTTEAVGDSQWLGLQAAAIAGLGIGALAFVMSGVAGLGDEAHH